MSRGQNRAVLGSRRVASFRENGAFMPIATIVQFPERDANNSVENLSRG